MPKITGKCHCGQNQFEINAAPEFQFICYCKDCRHLNSGGHLCGIIFDQVEFKAAKGAKMYRYSGGSAEPITLHFCGTCSTALYTFLGKYPGKVVIRANTLEDSTFKPEHVLFAESAFLWDKPVAI